MNSARKKFSFVRGFASVTLRPIFTNLPAESPRKHHRSIDYTTNGYFTVNSSLSVVLCTEENTSQTIFIVVLREYLRGKINYNYHFISYLACSINFSNFCVNNIQQLFNCGQNIIMYIYTQFSDAKTEDD